MNMIQAAKIQDIATQFWVVGGEYKDTTFRELCGQPEVFGPFNDYDSAMRMWRQRIKESMSVALARYTIAMA